MNVNHFANVRSAMSGKTLIFQFADGHGIVWKWSVNSEKFFSRKWNLILGEIPCEACVKEDNEIVFDLKTQQISSNLTTTFEEVDKLCEKPAKKPMNGCSSVWKYISKYESRDLYVWLSQKVYIQNNNLGCAGWIEFVSSHSMCYKDVLNSPFAHLTVVNKRQNVGNDSIVVILNSSAQESFDNAYKTRMSKQSAFAPVLFFGDAQAQKVPNMVDSYGEDVQLSDRYGITWEKLPTTELLVPQFLSFCSQVPYVAYLHEDDCSLEVYLQMEKNKSTLPFAKRILSFEDFEIKPQVSNKVKDEHLTVGQYLQIYQTLKPNVWFRQKVYCAGFDDNYDSSAKPKLWTHYFKTSRPISYDDAWQSPFLCVLVDSVTENPDGSITITPLVSKERLKKRFLKFRAEYMFGEVSFFIALFSALVAIAFLFCGGWSFGSTIVGILGSILICLVSWVVFNRYMDVKMEDWHWD